MGHKYYMSFGKNSLMSTMDQLQFLVHPTSIKFDVRAQPSQPHNDSFPTPTNDNVDTPHHNLLMLSPRNHATVQVQLSMLAVHYAEPVVYIYPISTCALKGKEYLLQFLCRCFVPTENGTHKGWSTHERCTIARMCQSRSGGHCQCLTLFLLRSSAQTEE